MADGVLRLGDGGLPVRSAVFTMRILSEHWSDTGFMTYGAVPRPNIYDFAIEVDDESGEDGAAQPMAQTIPLAGLDGRHPALTALPGRSVAGPDAAWDSWFGNDAPALLDNRMGFGAWGPGGETLHLRWEARLERKQDGINRLVYDGQARFSGIVLHVRRLEDADRLLEAGWGAQPAASLRRVDRALELNRWTPDTPERLAFEVRYYPG